MTTNLPTPDIRDIKPPVALPDPWAWVWWTLAALAVVAVAVAVWLVLRRKRLVAKIPVVMPPHVRAKEKLAEALRFIGDPKLFCTMVSDTARVYLEERFKLHAPERTTEEFLIELGTSPHLTPDQKQSLGEFLESCDLAKFARFEPTEQVLRELHDSALRLVDETQYEAIAVPSVRPPPQAPPPLPPMAPAPLSPSPPGPAPPPSPPLSLGSISLSGAGEAKRTASPLTPALSPLRGEGARRTTLEHRTLCPASVKSTSERRPQVARQVEPPRAADATPSPLNGERAGVRGEDTLDFPCNELRWAPTG